MIGGFEGAVVGAVGGTIIGCISGKFFEMICFDKQPSLKLFMDYVFMPVALAVLGNPISKIESGAFLEIAMMVEMAILNLAIFIPQLFKDKWLRVEALILTGIVTGADSWIGAFFLGPPGAVVAGALTGVFIGRKLIPYQAKRAWERAIMLGEVIGISISLSPWLGQPALFTLRPSNPAEISIIVLTHINNALLGADFGTSAFAIGRLTKATIGLARKMAPA